MTSKRLLTTIALALAFMAAHLAPTGDAKAAEAGPGEGLVIFTREDKFGGSAIRFNINVNGSPQLQLLAGTTIELPLPVGTHSFSVYTPSLDGQDHLTIDVQEGWTYVVEGTVRMGWPAGRPKFKLVSSTPPAAGATSASRAAPPQPAEQPLAGPALGAVAPQAGGQPVRSAEESGRLALRNFVGDWNLDMWSLAPDGSKLEGRGVAQGNAEGDSAVRIYITEFEAAAFPAATGGGQIRIAYEEGRGFSLESLFKHSNELFNFSGQYEAETGRYVFYLFGSQADTATGVPLRSTRVEVRSVDMTTWVADTYSSVDGQSLLVQSYRFSRRQ